MTITLAQIALILSIGFGLGVIVGGILGARASSNYAISLMKKHLDPVLARRKKEGD